MFRETHPVAQALRDPDTYTTALLAILLEQYGTESLTWTPQTIFQELWDDFGVDLPDQNRDQLVVGINLLTSDDFYQRLPYFIQACNVLAGSELSDAFDKADAQECAWGITEASLLVPPDNAREPFAPAIQQYLRHVLEEAGLRRLPPTFAELVGPGAQPRQVHVDDPDAARDQRQIEAERTAELHQLIQHNLSKLLEQLSRLSPEFKDRVTRLAAGFRRAS
jgi:hypothetical protein